MNTTRQSHTGPSRRADRRTPSRPVSATCGNSLPSRAMGRSPSVAPRPPTPTDTPPGPASAPLWASSAHSHTAAGAGPSTGPRPPPCANQTPQSPPRPPSPRGTGSRLDGASNSPRSTPGARPSRPQRKQANPKRIHPIPARQPGCRRQKPRQHTTGTRPHTHVLEPGVPGSHDPTQGPPPAQPPPPVLAKSPAPNTCALPTAPPPRPVPRTRLQGSIPTPAPPLTLCPHPPQGRRSHARAGDLGHTSRRLGRLRPQHHSGGHHGPRLQWPRPLQRVGD